MNRLIARIAICLHVLTCGASANRMAFSIDGIPAGDASNVEGGEVRGVVDVKPTKNGLSKKSISGLEYTPIVMELPLPFSKPVVTWLEDFLAGRSTVRHRMILVDSEFPGATFAAKNATLVEVRFPQLTRTSEQPASVTLVIKPESVGGPLPGEALPTSASLNHSALAFQTNFRLQIATLPTNHVVRFSAFTLKQSARENCPPECSNPIFAINHLPDFLSWVNWRENFLVKGNSGDPNENTGTLTLYSSIGKPLFALQFSNMGLVHLSREGPESAEKQTRVFQAEIYVERVALVEGSPSISVLADGSKGSAGGAGAASKGAGGHNEAGAAGGGAAGREASDTAGPPRVADVPIVLEVAYTDPADQGARDPAAFPRPTKTVRTGFSSRRQQTTQKDDATYAAVGTMEPLEEYYVRQLAAAGWELVSREENNLGGFDRRHQILLNYKTLYRTAGIAIVQVKKDGVEIDVKLVTAIPP